MKKLLFTLLLAAAGLTAWAEDVSISDAAGLKAYADGINAGTESRNAKLTADINLSSYNTWTPIGTDSHKFKLTFDGQGHKITNMTLDGSQNEQGLFGVAGPGAVIKNLIIDSSCTIQASSGKKCFAAFVGCCNNDGYITFENCGNEANVTGAEQNNAGFLGCNYGGTKLIFNNCYNKGKISGGRENGAFCGWTGRWAFFNNCYNIGEVENGEAWARGGNTTTNCYSTIGTDDGVTQLGTGAIASGELCYRLNGNQKNIKWYQTINTDGYPVPFSSGHNQVYASGTLTCGVYFKNNESYTYSNSGSITPSHTNSDGYCTVCNDYIENGITPNNGWYEIGNAMQLRWMAESVNEYNSTYGGANIKLTADIDYSSYTDQAAMFGKPSNTFRGTFDGQCHTITIAFDNTATRFEEEAGLFRRINGGTVKNLKVAGKITTNKKLAGGICSGIWQKGTITNCESAVTITDSQSGDGTHGGILACVHDTGDSNNINVLNCLFSGTLIASGRNGSAGIVGWTNNSGSVKVKNCLVTGTLTIADVNTNGVIVRSTCDGENNYYTCSPSSNLKKDYATEASDKKGTGELCYLLNGQVSGAEGWRQNLSPTTPVDAAPTPFSTSSVVYAKGNFYCDGVTPKEGTTISSYSNTNESIVDPHLFGTDGVCTVCLAAGREATLTDGVYQLTNAGNLLWWAQHVNAGNTSTNAKLTADADLSTAKYAPVGNSEHKYSGTFDGQGHKVTLALDNKTENNQGLFGVITNGASISNVITAGSVNGQNYVGGIVGAVDGGGNVTVSNCGNEATITTYAGRNGAGIIGVNIGKNSITIQNCYNKGDIIGNPANGIGNTNNLGEASKGEVAALCAWIGDLNLSGRNNYAKNCYNIGEVKVYDNTNKNYIYYQDFIRRNIGTTGAEETHLVNNYNLKVNITENRNATNNGNNNGTYYGIAITDADVTSGELCWKFVSDDGNPFTQDLSQESYPTFGSKEVHAGKWFNNDDWDVFYNEEGSSRIAYVLNLDETKTSFNLDPNFTLTAKNVSVARNIPANQWIGLCLPFDYNIPDGWDVRKLTGVSGSGEDASMKFSTASTIEAGKPYIVKPSAEVTTITAENKTIATAASTVEEGDVNMIGNFGQTDIAQGSFYINKSSELMKLTATSATLKGFRAYFTVDGTSNVKALSFDFDDDATAIEETLSNSPLKGENIYNVAGQRIQKMQKGINIVNGRKVLF